MLTRLRAAHLRSRNRRRARLWASTPRPPGPGWAHASGPDPDRVLIFGSGVAVGWGVRTHDLGLPGQLARQLRAETGRGSDIDLCAPPALPVRLAVGALGSERLERYDAVVLSIGIEDALGILPLPQWEEQASDLLDTVIVRTSGAVIAMLGLQPIPTLPGFDTAAGMASDRHARAMNRITRRLCLERGIAYIPVPDVSAADRMGGGPEAYAWIARLLAPNLAERISSAAPETRAWRRTAGADDEDARLRALHRVAEPGDGQDPALQRIAALARDMLDAPYAAVTLVDQDRQRYRAQAGWDLPEVDRGESFCQYTILQGEAMIVPDARQDPRFDGIAFVTADPGIRFYAGFPIESPDGYRIGALCVYDTAPRAARPSDARSLRDLAKLAQRELAREYPPAPG
jgi:hypothetical protein